MKFRELVETNRTRRKFDQSKPVKVEELVELVELARFVPTGMNMQPLKYIVTADQAQCENIFPLLGWAGYLKDWKGPAEGERPTGYVIVLLDKELSESPGCDHGIAAQTIMLGAVDKGYGGCMIATINRNKLAEIFGLSDRYDILLVLALGVPAQKVVVEPLPSDGSIKYWTGEDGNHHVPKRDLDEILIGRFPE